MKYLSLFLLFFSLNTFAQKQETFRRAAFRIDSLPAQGILLDKGWKFHAGDNPDWAKADFDDSNWESIDPTKDIFDLSQLKKDGSISWFRIRLTIDTVITRQLVLQLNQSGASEIYLNGKLIQTFGTISNNPAQIIAFTPNLKPFSFPITNGKEQVLAFRYAFQPNISYGRHFGQTNKVISAKINSVNHGSDAFITELKVDQDQNLYVASFGILFFIFLTFFLFFPNRKESLYFAVYAFLMSITWTSFFIEYKPINVEEIYFWNNLFLVAQSIAYVFSLLSVYEVLGQKRGLVFWGLAILGIIACFTGTYIYTWGWQVFGIVLSTCINIDIIRITIIAARKQKQGSWVLLVGGLIYLICWVLFQLGFNGVLSINNYLPFTIPFFLISILSIPIAFAIAFAIYFGYDFGITNRSLKQKLEENEALALEKQQILATQNETLEKQVAERTAELKASQNQLIQKEKLASLGELTAGIAHEIQNPLNFVNNFSEMSVELAQELKDEIKKTEKDWELIGDLAEDLSQNQAKINHHGKRASSIVSGMLEHSRTSTGERAMTDINKLADEYLRLSFHGMRAKYKNFNADYELIVDENLPLINVVPQDMGRVLLNLINNAFYASWEGALGRGRGAKVGITTKAIDNQVIITVSDNGLGIPVEVLPKIFQPFFTTKPTGEGTGLGLSLAYDIITKGHGGTIEVESVEGVGTTFTVKLPMQTTY